MRRWDGVDGKLAARLKPTYQFHFSAWMKHACTRIQTFIGAYAGTSINCKNGQQKVEAWASCLMLSSQFPLGQPLEKVQLTNSQTQRPKFDKEYLQEKQLVPRYIQDSLVAGLMYISTFTVVLKIWRLDSGLSFVTAQTCGDQKRKTLSSDMSLPASFERSLRSTAEPKKNPKRSCIIISRSRVWFGCHTRRARISTTEKPTTAHLGQAMYVRMYVLQQCLLERQHFNLYFSIFQVSNFLYRRPWPKCTPMRLAKKFHHAD